MTGSMLIHTYLRAHLSFTLQDQCIVDKRGPMLDRITRLMRHSHYHDKTKVSSTCDGTSQMHLRTQASFKFEDTGFIHI